MGPANLKAIERAAKKLERCDPDYANRMKRNREKTDRAQRHMLNRKFANALRLVVARGIPHSDPYVDTTDIGEQDAALLALAANDNGKPDEMPSFEPRLLTYKGERLTLKQWSDRTGIPRGTIQYRLNTGLGVERALSPASLRRRSSASPRGRGTRYEVNGQTKTLSEWSKAAGINEATLRTRIKKGWSIERAVSVPSGAVMGTGVAARMGGGGSELSNKAPGPVVLVRSTSNLNRVFENG